MAFEIDAVLLVLEIGIILRFEDVVLNDTESVGCDDIGSGGADLVAIEAGLAVLRGGEFASTVG